MLNLNRKVIRALEASTNAVRRDTAAKLKAIRALRELPDDTDLMDDEDTPVDAKTHNSGKSTQGRQHNP